MGHVGGSAGFKHLTPGIPEWLSSLAPPLAQGVILETQDQVPCQALCIEPACAFASLSLSVCVSHE